MAITIPLASLLVMETKNRIYAKALSIAQSVGLPVTSWQPGDPTRTQLSIESEFLEGWEEVIAGFIASGFLDYATGTWLKIIAEQVYGVTVPEATYATTTVRLTNNGGGYYPDLDPGDVIFKNTTSGKTYRSTSGGTLASGPGTWLDVTVVADDPGSDGSAGVGEIDDLVTTMLGVTVANAAPAVGLDEQSEDTTRQLCRAKLGSFSPNGPKEAYSYVAQTPSLTGTSAITRCRVYAQSDTGSVMVYLASAAGAVLESDRALVEAAILKWATPLCITPTVLSSVPVTIPVTYDVWVYKSVGVTADVMQQQIENALEQMLASRPIGGDVIPPSTTGAVYASLIESTIRNLYPQIFRVVVSLPAGDVSIPANQVPALGLVTPVIHVVVDPVTAPARFRTLRRIAAPAWLTNGEGGLLGYTLDLLKDAFVERAQLGHLARFPQSEPTGRRTAPPDALIAMGRDRRVVKGMRDTNVTFAKKLLRWLDDRPSQGNPFTLMRKLAEYTGPGPAFRTVDMRGNWYSRAADGTESALLKQANWSWDATVPSSSWSRFWVIIYPNGVWTEGTGWNDPTGPGWGDAGATNGSPGTIGSTATQEQVASVRGLVEDWKPGGTRCVNIIVAFDPATFNPSSPEPDGLWGRDCKYVAGVAVPNRVSTARYWDGV